MTAFLRRISVLMWLGSAGTLMLAVLAPERYVGILQAQTVWAALGSFVAIFVWFGSWVAGRSLLTPLIGGLGWAAIDLVRAGTGWPLRLPPATDAVVYVFVAVPTAICYGIGLVALLRHDFRPQLAEVTAAGERARSDWVTGLVSHVRTVLDDARTGTLPVLSAAARIGGVANGLDGAVPAVVRSAVYRARDDLRTIASSAPVDQDAQVADAAARFDRSINEPGVDGVRMALPRRNTGLVVLVIVLVVVAIAAFAYVGGSWSILIDVGP